jgi:metal-responsive CopG/Arc/MetJ family transcriptional regulator
MSDKKKLVGVYLPVSLIAKLKAFISRLYLEKGIEKNQSEIIEEAIKEYLSNKAR